MLSAAAYMFDIALTGESFHACVASSNGHHQMNSASTRALLAQAC